MPHTDRLCVGCARHVRRAEVRRPLCGVELVARERDSAAFCLTDASRIAICLALVSGCERSPSSSVDVASTLADAGSVTQRAPVVSQPVPFDARAAPLSASPPQLGHTYGGPAWVDVDDHRARASVALERVTVVPDDIDHQREAMALRTQLGRIRQCFEGGLRQSPTIAGDLQLRYEVDSEGRVTQPPVVEQGISPVVDLCVASTIRTMMHGSGRVWHRMTARFRMRATD